MSLRKFLKKSSFLLPTVMLSIPSVSEAEDSSADLKKDPLLQKMFLNVKEQEGCTQHPYFDINGNITIGYGHLVPNLQAFTNIAFINTETQKALTTEETVKYYNDIVTEKDNIKKDHAKKVKEGKVKKESNPFNYRASFYAKKFTFVATEESIQTLCFLDMNDARSKVKKTFTANGINFDNLSLELKLVPLDICFQCGNISSFSKFMKALREGEFEGETGMKAQSKRRGMTKRNAFVLALLTQAQKDMNNKKYTNTWKISTPTKKVINAKKKTLQKQTSNIREL